MNALKNNFTLLIALSAGLISTAIAEELDDRSGKQVFMGATFVAGYPAADDETTAAFISYVIYRGDIFPVGDEGAFRALACNDRVNWTLAGLAARQFRR